MGASATLHAAQRFLGVGGDPAHGGRDHGGDQVLLRRVDADAARRLWDTSVETGGVVPADVLAAGTDGTRGPDRLGCPCNSDYMITSKMQERVSGWFAGRLPAEWQPVEVTVDKEEVTVVLATPDVELGADASEAARAEARAGRASAFREETRQLRMEIAQEAEHRFERKVSWGLAVGEHRVLWTHVSAPVMTRLRQPERMVLDTLVDAGVARSRSDALGWCVRLVGQHEGDWIARLREAMDTVAQVRAEGPAA